MNVDDLFPPSFKPVRYIINDLVPGTVLRTNSGTICMVVNGAPYHEGGKKGIVNLGTGFIYSNSEVEIEEFFLGAKVVKS